MRLGDWLLVSIRNVLSMMNYSILLPRRSLTPEHELEPEAASSTHIFEVLQKDKKSAADVRLASDYFQRFK